MTSTKFFCDTYALIELTKNNSRLDTCKSELGKIKKRREDLNSNITDIDGKIKELAKQKAGHEHAVLSTEKERDLYT